MNIFKILIILFLTTFLSSKAFAAKGEATVYKVTITKIEMCDSTSTASSCNGAATVFSGDSGPIDIASTTAGESAAGLGNLSGAKIGETYSYVQVTMKRAMTVKGSAKDGAGTTCVTAEDGTNALAAEGAASSATPAEVTLFAAFVGDASDGLPLNMNSVDDATGSGPDPAGTIANAHDFFQYRNELTAPITLKAGSLPSVKIAFGTSQAVEAVGNMGDCTQNIAAQVGFIAAEPDITITITN